VPLRPRLATSVPSCAGKSSAHTCTFDFIRHPQLCPPNGGPHSGEDDASDEIVTDGDMGARGPTTSPPTSRMDGSVYLPIRAICYFDVLPFRAFLILPKLIREDSRRLSQGEGHIR
jgi:hypothetical protein